MWQWIKNQYHLMQAFLANIYYGFPSGKLTVIGVTGTSGKTTTASMIYEMLKKAGYKVSLLSTIKAVIAGKEYDTGFHVTTPDPWVLPKFFKDAVSCGDTHFILEVSSHALDQNRAGFVQFEIGVLTTLAHEHLDYHKTMDNYARAKLKLLVSARHAVTSEKVIEKIKHLPEFAQISKKLTTFGVEKGDQTQKKWNLKLKVPGVFNLYNALASATVGSILGVPIVTIKKSLDSFSGIAGRFEEVENKKGIKIIIDFAHKPDALEESIRSARAEIDQKNKVIVLFGAASQRDVLKRPIMGKIASELADVIILTDEDPRLESSDKIINEIAEGCLEGGAKELTINNEQLTMNENRHVFIKIPNRTKAVDFAINSAAKLGDIVLLCGKGHEKSMNYNGKELPYNEHEAVEKALKNG